MPHRVPVSKLMVRPSEWPQLRSDTDVDTAIRILRIVTEDRKLEHGHSTPLVFDEHYNLLGFVHLLDLLKSDRPRWSKPVPEIAADVSPPSAEPVRNLVRPFTTTLNCEDSIVTALDIMIEHCVSMLPVMENGKFVGLIKLSGIFGEVAAILFDNDDSEEKDRLMRDYRF